MFHAKYEDTRNGRTWQGVVKYVIGALIEVTGAPPEHKLFVSTIMFPIIIHNTRFAGGDTISSPRLNRVCSVKSYYKKVRNSFSSGQCENLLLYSQRRHQSYVKVSVL